MLGFQHARGERIGVVAVADRHASLADDRAHIHLAGHVVDGAAGEAHPGRQRRFDYGEHVVAEEHVLVPKPGQSGELDAWLLGTTYDARRQATVLNLLDAAHIEDGPLAQAVLPYALPLGFHGNFTAA